MVQHPDSSLPSEDLKLGSTAMNSKWNLWLKDLENGLFKLEKVSDDAEEVDSQPLAEDVSGLRFPTSVDRKELVELNDLVERNGGIGLEDND